MSSSRNSSVSSSRSNSKSLSRQTKGKSIMKKAYEKLTGGSEGNYSDIEQAGPSGINPIEPNVSIENWDVEGDEIQRQESDSDSENVVRAERGRVRRREGRDNDSFSGHESPSSRNKHLAYTRANPLGKILLDMAADNLALQQRTGLTESNLNAADLCTAFFNQIELERQHVRKELKRVSELTEQRILTREFESLCVQENENMPKYFSVRSKLISNANKIEAMRIFPIKNKFSGHSGNDSLPLHEFFSLMEAAQIQMRLTEKEFLHMLLMCTSHRAHELIQQWVDQGESIGNIYFNLSLQYDKRISPEAAKIKLSNLMAPKNTDLPKHLSTIMNLADRASYSLPQGPTRKSYYDYEAIQALIRSLPPVSRNLCSNLYHQLSGKARRALTFMELSRPLTNMRFTIDQDIKQNGAAVVNNNKSSYNSGSKKKKGGNKNYSTYAINVDGTGNQGTSQGSTAVVYHNSVQNTGTVTGNGNGRGNNSAPNKGKFNKKGNEQGKVRRYCSLCGKTSHTAVDGCRNMVDDSGAIINIQPAQSTCNICPSSITPRLHHPSYLCPYRSTGPFRHHTNK